MKSWKKFGEIFEKNCESLRKMWYFGKSLVRSWETFGVILKKNWWCFRESSGKSREQLGQKLGKKLSEILGVIM